MSSLSRDVVSLLATHAPRAVAGTRQTSEVTRARPIVAATFPRIALVTAEKRSPSARGRKGMIPGRNSMDARNGPGGGGAAYPGGGGGAAYPGGGGGAAYPGGGGGAAYPGGAEP